MKKIYISVSFLLMLSYFCIAQPPGSRQDNVEILKTAYITRQLNLSQEEAQLFWPVYNNYFAEVKKARVLFQNDEIKYEEKLVEVRKKYQGDFRKILGSDERVNKLFVVEKNFYELMKNELKKRQQNKRPNGVQRR